MFRFDGGLIGVIQGSDKDYRASWSLGLLLLMGFERISMFWAPGICGCQPCNIVTPQ